MSTTKNTTYDWLIHDIDDWPRENEPRRTKFKASLGPVLFAGEIDGGKVYLDRSKTIRVTTSIAKALYFDLVSLGPDGMFVLPEADAIRELIGGESPQTGPRLRAVSEPQ